MNQMYSAQSNSPYTTLNGAINNSVTSITVTDGSLLPSAPNLITFSYDTSNPETVLMTNKVGNVLTVTRGVDGTAQSHLNNAKVARVMTAKDLNDIQSNVLDNETKSLNVQVDFGSTGQETYVETVVTGQTWVTSNTRIVPSLINVDSGERSAEDGLIEGITLGISNIIAGTGFTVQAYAPNGSNGIYNISCIGRVN